MMSQVMQHTNASGAEAMKASSASSSAGMMIFAGQSRGMANRARADAGPPRTGAGLGQKSTGVATRNGFVANCQSASEMWYILYGITMRARRKKVKM